jgi:protein-S-isoprenylcysteine O-methyltransferase Ste14
MKKLNFLGIGPKIGLIGLPYLAVSIVISLLYKKSFRYPEQFGKPLFIAGIVLLVVGLVFYLVTARLLIKGLRKTLLITSGTYFLCQNPLYATFIFLFIPGLSLLLNSWLILTSSIIFYLVFKIYIKSEYRELELFFGEQYKLYKLETPELWPFPIKKILRHLRANS